MAKMTALQVVLTFSTIFALVASDKVPVLMWSQTRSLADLPQTFAGNSINRETFLNEYLSPLTGKAGHHIVAFIQDKLHMEDFTKYADVYNQFSDGGVFKNIKGLVDEHSSVNLPSVISPASVIDGLKKTFNGNIHEVSSPEHVSALNIEKDKSYLILVVMPLTQEKNEEKSISENDEKVGAIVKALNKRSLEYTAVFTGKRSERDTDAAYKGRHLLATADNNVTGVFVNISGQMFFYTRNITVTVVDTAKKEKMLILLPTDEDSYTFNKSTVGNSSRMFVLETTKATSNMSGGVTKYSVTIKVTAVKKVDRWVAANFSISLTNTTDKTIVVDEQDMSLQETWMELPPIFSYHCSKLVLAPKNRSTTYASITFDGFQFQPYGLRNNRFSDSWDCVGFFTTPIWMGLFPVGIFTVILFLGMYMLSQLSTMDRFDDPKGKTITVNVNE